MKKQLELISRAKFAAMTWKICIFNAFFPPLYVNVLFLFSAFFLFRQKSIACEKMHFNRFFVRPFWSANVNELNFKCEQFEINKKWKCISLIFFNNWRFNHREKNEGNGTNIIKDINQNEFYNRKPWKITSRRPNVDAIDYINIDVY